MARPVKFNKLDVLDRALEVFWEKGYEATSLSDLIDAMALSKSSFYNTFDNKHQIFIEALCRYNECMAAPLRESLSESSSGLEFIRALFTEIIGQAEASSGLKGCFLVNTATEISPN
jgi:TetR/AcrR family transcriptional repressor of nem operon